MGFTYDAIGRVVIATKANPPDATTVYDGLGNRVATKVNDVWQYMIYDSFGQLVAEYGAPSEGMGGVKYVQQDHQGSVRTVTNTNGFVVSRTDHQAFGETVGADFKFIVVFRRKDGKPLDNADKAMVVKSASQANRRTLSDGDKAVVIGSNFPFAAADFQALSERFAMENYSKPDSGEITVANGNSNR